MGLKWFRARLTMNKNPKKKNPNITSVAGFYRPMSQFDTNVQPIRATFLREEENAQNQHPVETPAEPIAHNPMAGLNNQDIETPVITNDIVSRLREQLAIRNVEENKTNEELESTNLEVPTPLPRDTINLTRHGNDEFHRIGSKSRKIDFKRKKVRAPIPQMTDSSAEVGQRFITFGKGRGSSASEIEI